MANNGIIERQLAELHIDQHNPDESIELEWTPTVTDVQNISNQSNRHTQGYYSARSTPVEFNKQSIGQSRLHQAISSSTRSWSLPEELNKQGLQDDKHMKSNKTTPLCSPIRSSRLRPFRQKTKKAMISILDDGSVSMEFFKKSDSQEHISHTFRISTDGLKIKVHSPVNDDICTDKTTNPKTEGAVKEYNYNDLPKKYWKKYQYAAKFIELVQSKTPKVTVYTTKAKCMLMETLSDFEVVFYDGVKLYFSKDSTKLVQPNGSCLTFESPESIKDLAPHMWGYVEECRQHCIKLEKVYKTLEDSLSKDMPLFPVTIGRRPECPNDSTLQLPKPVGTSTPNDVHLLPATQVRKEQVITSSPQHPTNHTKQRVTHPEVCASNQKGGPQTPRYTPDVTVDRSVSSNCSTSSGSRKSGPFAVCKIFIRDIGWASQWSNGGISVQYTDGCELSIQQNPMRVCFTNVKGITMRFTSSDQLPVLVRRKMENLPVVMETLELAQLKKSNE